MPKRPLPPPSEEVVPTPSPVMSLSGSTLVYLECEATGLELTLLAKGVVDSSTLLLVSCGGPLPTSDTMLALLASHSVKSIVKRGSIPGPTPTSPTLGCALVKFASAAAATRLLSRSLSGRSTVDPSSGAPRGLRAWLSRVEAASIVDTRGLQASVDATVAALDEAQAAAASEKETLRARMLADGFTLVTRKTTLEGEEEEAEGEERRKKKKKKAGKVEVGAFYNFQKTDEKLKRLEQLRAGFAEDKLTISRIQSQRKFKPF